MCVIELVYPWIAACLLLSNTNMYINTGLVLLGLDLNTKINIFG